MQNGEESRIGVEHYRLSSDDVHHSNMDISHFDPTVQTVQYTNQYRSNLPRAGLFQCRATGWVFEMTGEGEVVYRTVQWEERCLQSTGRTPAGPLYDIQCPQKSVSQLRLPHCDIKPGDLSVAHITEEGVQLLKPLRVTPTHVVINVTRLSIFGLLETFSSHRKTQPKRAQVLLFLRPPGIERRLVNVFLLPANVAPEEVMRQHRKDKVLTTSDCALTNGQRYRLQCSNPSYEVDPEVVKHHQNYGPVFHPTHEVTVDLDAETVPLKLLRSDEVVWQKNTDPRGVAATIPAPARHFVDKNRRFLIKNVTKVDSILDLLLEEDIITMDAYRGVRAKSTKEEQVREVYRLLNSVRAKDTFYQGLEEEEKPLLDELKAML